MKDKLRIEFQLKLIQYLTPIELTSQVKFTFDDLCDWIDANFVPVESQVSLASIPQEAVLLAEIEVIYEKYDLNFNYDKEGIQPLYYKFSDLAGLIAELNVLFESKQSN